MNKKLAIFIVLGCLVGYTGCNSGREGMPDTTTESNTADMAQSQVEVVAKEQAEGQANSEANAEAGQITEISEAEQEKIFKHYVQEYYITGMLYDTWENAEQIDVNRLINFYRYNALYQKIGADPDLFEDVPFLSIPADEVTGYIINRFDVSDAYLKTAENYDSETDTFRFSTYDGIGSAPAPELVNIVHDGDLMTLYYKREGITMDLTLRLEGENYKYISCKSSFQYE